MVREKVRIDPNQNPWAPKLPKAQRQKADTTHILVVNGGNDLFLWMDHCLAAIERLTHPPYEVHIFDYNGRTFPGYHNVHRPSEAFHTYRRARFNGRTDYISYQHQSALSYLASKIQTGWIITIDSDTIPYVQSWNRNLVDMAWPKNLVAVSRRLGRDVHPGASQIAHPSCLCIWAPLYRKLRADFFGYPRHGSIDTNPAGVYNDTACRLTRRAQRKQVPIKRLFRANDFTGLKDLMGSGPSLFGIYGNAVYHHGCGSRNFNKRWPSWVRELSDIIIGKLMSNFEDFVEFIKEGKR